MAHLLVQRPCFAFGLTVCRWRMPGGRRFIAVCDDFGSLIEVGSEHKALLDYVLNN